MRILADYVVGIHEDGKMLHYIRVALDSSETLPDNDFINGHIVDGSNALMTDSAEVYLYNEKTSAWKKASGMTFSLPL